jgi:cation:H+ antiporter
VSALANAALLVGGVVLLYFGAEWLVRGAAGLAAKLRVRPLIIGLTVVAYGTSAPELVVGIGAALTGRGGIAFGNAIGSNIANIGLILGVTALIAPPKVDGSLVRRELPVMIASALAVPLLLLDGRISRVEGAGLLLATVLYTVATVRGSRTAALSTDEAALEAAEVAEEARAAVGAPQTHSIGRLLAIAVLGLAVLLVGGHFLVDGASATARSLGVSERLIGLTIVAVGTSVPELATSLIAARRGHSEIALGNVVGSNIFNVLLILGASGAVKPLEASLGDSRVEVGGLIVMTAAALFVMRGERKIARREGAVLLLLYVVFLVAVAVAQGV